MSTTLDLTLLKMETPSVHSSPHRILLKHSNKGSPSIENMDIQSTYAPSSSVVLSRTNNNFKYTTLRYSLEDTEHQAIPKLAKPQQVIELNNDRSESNSPVIANFLTSECSEKSQNKLGLCKTDFNLSSADILEQGIYQLETTLPTEQHFLHSSDNIDEVSNPPSDASVCNAKGSLLSEQPLVQMTLLSSDCIQKENSCSSYTTDVNESSSPSDNVSDQIIENNNGDNKPEEYWSDENDDEDDDDQVECAECNKVFSNLQSYMDHTCYRSIEGSRPLHLDLKHKSSLPRSLIDQSISDVISFPGILIFNRNGSVFVIEDISVSTSGSDSVVVSEGQSVLSIDFSVLPQISTVMFFPKRNPCQTSSISSKSSSPSHGYHVFDVGTAEADDLLDFISSSGGHESSPIFMCFICKIIVCKMESFLNHATKSHSVILAKHTQLLLRQHNTSLICHVHGQNKRPKLSVLYPMDNNKATSPDKELASTSSGRILADFIALKESTHSEGRLSPCQSSSLYTKSIFTSQGKSDMTSENHNSNPGCCRHALKLELKVSSLESPSSPLDIKPQITSENNIEISSPAASVASEDLKIRNLFESTHAAALGLQTSLSTHMSSPLYLASNPLMQSSSAFSNPAAFHLSSSSLPSFSLMAPNLSLSSRTQQSLHPNGIQRPNFLCICNDALQGKSQGMECPKCDNAIISSQSLGGHMTMTHSRNSCKTLKCPKCNWHYKYQETLEIHMKEKHAESDAQCVYCLTNQIHPRLARGESYSCGYKPYRCEVCNYSTTTKGNLSIHMQSDKHINNMQDLAASNTDHMMQPQQSPVNHTLPITTTASLPNNTSSYTQDDSQLKNSKQKHSFRCDVCSYETSVARNLRIHMTSEKHTHNMLVINQNINHVHQDPTLHQINQMNQLVALNQLEYAARFKTLGPHLPSDIFSYEESAMRMSSENSPPSVNLEVPLNLTKENGTDKWDRSYSNKDAKKMFGCCVCCQYDSDSVEMVQNHIQRDRTKSGNTETHVTFNNGIYYCNLCSYKTQLKANFQLHCKTDKHVQKLQVANHILEAGPDNEWKSSHSGSSMLICCNACGFHATSSHKMQLHLSTIEHEVTAQLFKHLQSLDNSTPATAPGNVRYYQCSLCAENVRTKQQLINHSKTPYHMRKEKSLLKSQMTIFDVYFLKEMTDGEHVDFNDEGDETNRHHPKDDEILNISNHTTPVPSADYNDTTTPTSAAISHKSGTNNNVLTIESYEQESPEARESYNSELISETDDLPRTSALSSRNLDSSPSTEVPLAYDTVSNKSNKRFRSDARNNSCTDLTCGTNPQVKISDISGAEARNSGCVLCPLCRHECAQRNLLEDHLVKKHKVAEEGIERLLSMVDMPLSASSNMPSPDSSSSSSLSSSSCADINHTESFSSFLLASHPLSTTPSAAIDSAVSSTSNKQMFTQGANNLDSKSEQSVPCEATHETFTTTNIHSDIQVTSRRMSASSSSPSSLEDSVTSSASMVTISPAPPILLSSHTLPPLNAVNNIMAIKNEGPEINLERLEAEHASLLAREGIDLALQEKMNKDLEEMFHCQTCSKSFRDIDRLYEHQNELGHLELKQTQWGPGYLCWKKGCNQYFNTASTLQTHFREIHTKKSLDGILSPEELELYKFKCGQCNFSFKTLETMQKHTLIHLIQSVTQCGICCKRFNSVSKIKRHLGFDHGDMSLSYITLQLEGIETNAHLLSLAPGYEQFMSNNLLVNGNIKPRYGVSETNTAIHEGNMLKNGLDVKDKIESHEECMDESDMLNNYTDKQFLDEIMNNQSMAEQHYNSTDCKHKCHRCKMGFSNLHYLFAHKKSSVHKRNEARPYMCDVCKESFTQKNSLLVHYNSISHLHKSKLQGEVRGDNHVNIPTSSHLIPPQHPLSPSVKYPTPSAYSNGNSHHFLESFNGSSLNIKPYKCNICKVGYNNQPSFEIHLRSVGHKTKASKLGELANSGQIDVNRALIEHPDARIAGKQQAQIIADMIHQQASAQAASNAAASYFNLQGLQGVNAMAQLSLLGIPPSTSHHLFTSSQNALAAVSNAQLEAYYSSMTSSFKKERHMTDNTILSSSRDYIKEKHSQIDSTQNLAEVIKNTVMKQDSKKELDNGMDILDMADDTSAVDGKVRQEDNDLHPHFHAPIIARPRGFMGRFKPQLYKSLLENFGFECVMHFNEENTRKMKEIHEPKEETKAKDKYTEEIMENDGFDKDPGVIINEKDKENIEKDEDNKNKVETNAKKEEVKSDLDLTELSKQTCSVCHKDFSNIWVLKNHEEEMHNYCVPPDVIEDYGQRFKEEWGKNLIRSVEQEQATLPQPASNISTPTASSVTDKIPAEMPPPKPPAQPQISQHFELSQLLPLMSMNLLPMHLSMNLANLSLQNSLMPSLMMPTMDMSQGFLSPMPPPPIIDSSLSMSSQQQLHAAAAAAAQNQKRVRTRISDDQLKVLRQYFDINNSPSEEQVSKMSDQTGLPQKVIKHWFRNTLFKERQRNKDSPYNFNNPPSTSFDMDEYDRTGKIPEIKIEPEDEYDRDTTSMSEIEKDNPSAIKENAEEKSECTTELIENMPVMADFTSKIEPINEGKEDPECHPNTPSPPITPLPSIPSTSAPVTPTPAITGTSMSSPLAFSLDSYTANMARFEAATFQSLGKRANRTRFTDYQIKTLQDYFEQNAYPKDDELEHLSKILGLSARVIVVWFQNARQKARKIYENHSPNESMKDSFSHFQRMSGQNYHCKKCNSVFQRYYELIKHQKNSCVGESNNNKPIPSMIEDDSNLSYSNDDSILSDHVITPVSESRNKDMQPRLQLPELLHMSNSTTPQLSNISSVTLTSPHSSSSPSSVPAFKCDKCTITFSKYDNWQDHQRAHNLGPAMFSPFSVSPVFGTLQNTSPEDNKTTLTVAALSTSNSLLPSMISLPSSSSYQMSAMTTTPTSSLSPSPSSKRKTDSEDESGEMHKDKRLRTTILPEQLDYLYQQYQIDCNPSRKQLEHIANTVNLKKRVVQVWFQNTRARERKGHYRAHQQLINKRCPFCRALFRAKSALESHLATKHPEEMAKRDINIDLIPDAVFEPPGSHTSLAAFSSAGSSSSSMYMMSDISKFLPPSSSAAMPNYMTFMSTTNGLNFPYPGPTPDMLSHQSFEDPFFKKYMNNVSNNVSMAQECLGQSSSSHLSTSPTTSTHLTTKQHAHQTASDFSPLSRPLEAHKAKSIIPHTDPIDDAPLDLSKPSKVTENNHNGSQSRSNYSVSLDLSERSMEMDYLQRLNNMDDSFSETQSELADQEYTNDIGNSPSSPSSTFNHSANTSASIGKRYRTQMSAQQVKVMKHLFQEYKTPTMSECELLGQEIGLAKRVVQVWFQNARAKEKKAKLNSGTPFSQEADFIKTPEDCNLCSYKYTHKVTIQDHIFTKTHIDRVKAFLKSHTNQDTDVCSTSYSGLSQSKSEVDQSHNKMWNDSVTSRHVTQSQTKGINSGGMGYSQGENNPKRQEKELLRKEKKAEGSKDEQQQNQAAIELAMNAQMMSALGSYIPSFDPAYLSCMYSGLPGYYPGVGLSMIQPGLIPEHLLAYDHLAYGTPLALLQIPAAAIKSVSDKVTDTGAVLARYTQDCQALADLNSVVSAADLTVAAEATLDVGYICKKCQMVYPAKESCMAHQHTVCMVNTTSLPRGFEPIVKLEQVQYECRACNERFSTILEFKSHCQQESHKHKLMKFKAKITARRDAAESPNSSAAYASSSTKVTSSSPLYSSKPPTASPFNNNSSKHNNNQVTSPGIATGVKSTPVSSPSYHYSTVFSPAAQAPSVFKDKCSPTFSELADVN